MARCVITIEDREDGNVAIIATPHFAELIAVDISGNSITPAHTYALHMLNAATAFSKKAQGRDFANRIMVPKVRHAH